jgi:hypothetical protein
MRWKRSPRPLSLKSNQSLNNNVRLFEIGHFVTRSRNATWPRLKMFPSVLNVRD